MRYALLAAAALSAACATPFASRAPVEPAQPSSEGAHAGVKFIENDLPGALARAKAENKPLFVDAWAPW